MLNDADGVSVISALFQFTDAGLPLIDQDRGSSLPYPVAPADNSNRSDYKMEVNHDLYKKLVAFDDIAFAALKVSLLEPERTEVVERLRQDWMSDVGVVGVIRREQIISGSVEQPARLYWESRREPLSPRVESLLASFLLNLASAVVYDVLKELIAGNYDIVGFLRERGADLASITSVAAELPVLTQQANLFLHLYRAKQDVRRAEEIKKIVAAVISGQKCTIRTPDVEDDFKIFMRNLTPAVRGIVKTELKKKGVYVADEADAVLTLGLAASPGFGVGRTIRWKRGSFKREPPYVLLIPEQRSSKDLSFLPAIEESSAVVTWGGGMTSHIGVACRTLGRPAVVINEAESGMIERKKFLVVDGTNGEVRSFNRLPSVVATWLQETPDGRKYKRIQR